MYLSASEVGLSYLGRYTKCSTFTFNMGQDGEIYRKLHNYVTLEAF